MLIDEFLPVYHVAERHHVSVCAPVSRVYGVVRSLDLHGSKSIRLLFILRELPGLLTPSRGRQGRLGLTLNDLLDSGFVLLGETPDRELVLGLVGRFWTPLGDIQRVDAAGFRAFARPGYAKAAWNFTLHREGNGRTRLATETRVWCSDDVSRRALRLYWSLVGPFSGLIRREMLRTIKRTAER